MYFIYCDLLNIVLKKIIGLSVEVNSFNLLREPSTVRRKAKSTKFDLEWLYAIQGLKMI